MPTRLETYLALGVLPPDRYLTIAQKEAIAHAPADESIGSIAQRIGADVFAVQRYRALTFGLVATRVHWPVCPGCRQRFATRFATRLYHEDCRRFVDRRIATRKAA